MYYLNVVKTKQNTLIQIEEKNGYVYDLDKGKTKAKNLTRIRLLLHTEQNPINQEEK